MFPFISDIAANTTGIQQAVPKSECTGFISDTVLMWGIGFYLGVLTLRALLEIPEIFRARGVHLEITNLRAALAKVREELEALEKNGEYNREEGKGFGGDYKVAGDVWGIV